VAAASYNSGDYGICTAARPLAIQTEAAYVARFLRSLLPPKRKRGRPGIASVTKAILLLKKFKHQYPTEKPEQIWKRIYPEAIPGYTSMDPERQKAERLLLRDRVRNRGNQHRGRVSGR